MRGRWRLAMAAGMVLTATAVAGARERQTGGDEGKSAATVTYTFERPGLAVPSFRMSVREDGSGQYTGKEVLAAMGTGGAPAGDTATEPVERKI